MRTPNLPNRPLIALAVCAAVALAAPTLGIGAPRPAAKPAAAMPKVPAGEYTADPAHTSLNFRVLHLGLSHYTARFTGVQAKLNFDPAHPGTSSVKATIDPRTIQTNYPDPAQLNFDEELQNKFFDVVHFPTMTFKSTRVVLTGGRSAQVYGDLTLHGVTHPVVLTTTFNGGYPPNAYDPMGARIGFSARTVLKRSDFGIKYGIPAPGTQMGVSDEVEVAIEAEFTRLPPKP